MKYYILLFISAITFYACNRRIPTTPVADIPSCIQYKIDSIKKLPIWNPPAEVYVYNYNNKKVFLFSADCCDFFSIATDENCNYICAPSGGFTGKGDGKCTDFNERATLVKLVWRDERK